MEWGQAYHVPSQNRGEEATKDTKHDEGLLQRDEQAAHERWSHLTYVNRRSVHCGRITKALLREGVCAVRL